MVRNALLEQVETNSNITVHMGWTLESFDDTSDPSCVQVTFQKTLVNEEEKLFKGAMLVGTDGVYSSLRTWFINSRLVGFNGSSVFG
jgi:2-polyprenyl-6-methoxyphenol hydroxylase-like FAD-dependent oxidoreductase